MAECSACTPYYQDDLATLYHGDCRDVREWLDADVLVTDPPYGVHRTTFSRTTTLPPVIAGERPTGRGSARALGAEHVAVRDAALALWGRRPAIVFGSWRAPRPNCTRMRLIWDRGHLGNGGVRPWRPVDEEVYLVGDWPNPRGGGGWCARSSILRHWLAPTGGGRPAHPTPKPVSLMAELIEHCPPGVIADPFAGSGSTLVAAKLQGRRAVGVELEERYCAIAAERLSQDALPFEVA